MANGKKFRLTGYQLDTTGLPLVERRRINGNPEEVPTTIGKVYRTVVPIDPETRKETYLKFEVEDRVTEVAVRTESGEQVFAGEHFNKQMLYETLRLLQDFGVAKDEDGELIDPFQNAVWFWYDQIWGETGPRDYFFVVFNNRIVREHLTISVPLEKTVDPLNFIPLAGSYGRALSRFWYSKFCCETITGRLMVLRHRRSELNHYHRQDDVVASLRGIRVVLWVLILIAGLILVRLLK